jgi:hypothetical protein
MLLQTNSYIVPPEKRAEHARLMRRFRQVLNRIGCDNFEVYEQVGSNWAAGKSPGRYVQIMRFRDRKHQLAVQNAERSDPAAQELIAEFCELVNYPYQVQQNMFAVGFYNSVLPVAPVRVQPGTAEQLEAEGGIAPAAVAASAAAAAEVTPQEEIEAQIDPESSEAEILADQAAAEAESQAGQAADEQEVAAQIEEPASDQAQGETEEVLATVFDDEVDQGDTGEETLASEESFSSEEPVTSEEDSAPQELAAEESPNGEEHHAPAQGQEHAELEERLEIEALPSAQGGESGEGETDFNLSEDDLAEIARELSDEPGDQPAENGRGRGADPQNRM